MTSPLLSNHEPLDTKRSNWLKSQRFRKVAVGLTVVWMLVFFDLTRLGIGWQQPYRLAIMLVLGCVFFTLGCFGLYRVFRGGGCLDLSIALLAVPFCQLFVFTSDVRVQTLLVAMAFGDLLVCALLAPGTISRVMYEVWIQAKQEAVRKS